MPFGLNQIYGKKKTVNFVKHMSPVLTWSERRGLTDLCLAFLCSVLLGYAMRGQIDVKLVQVLPGPWVAVTFRHQHVENVSRRTPSGGKRVTTVITLQYNGNSITTLIALQHYGKKENNYRTNAT